MKKHPFIFTWVAILALLTLSYPSNAQERNKTRVFSRTASQLISPRVTISSTPNADGIVFGSLGTATKGIDLSSSGLAGNTDYLVYFDASNYWRLGGAYDTTFKTIGDVNAGGITIQGGNSRIYFVGSLALFPTLDLLFTPTRNTISLLTSVSSHLMGNSIPIGTWAADGVSSAGTANITDVGGAAHGLSLAVGDLVHITNCTTASHKGFYRIVTAGATTLVLDRVLAATDTDLTVTFYKDVIGFFATDGTNGQRITGYSHQDKPLQVGGDVLAATGHSLGGEDVLIGGQLEVDGDFYFDGVSLFFVDGAYIKITTTNVGRLVGTGLRWYDDKTISFGTIDDSKFLYETRDANANALFLALPVGGAVDVPVFVIGDQGIIDAGADTVGLGWFDGITEPSIAIVNAAENAYVRYGSTVDVSANSTGAGSILLKGTTARDSTGFLAITVTGTTYYIPFFTTITG